MGADTVWHNWECSQAGDSQHSGSSQSTKPSIKIENVILFFSNLIFSDIIKPP